MAIPNVTPRPTLAGAVVLTASSDYPTRLVRSVPQAQWVKQRYFVRSGGSVTATVVPIYADGTVAGANADAKTFLGTLALDQIIGPRIGIRAAQRLKAA